MNFSLLLFFFFFLLFSSRKGSRKRIHVDQDNWKRRTWPNWAFPKFQISPSEMIPLVATAIVCGLILLATIVSRGQTDIQMDNILLKFSDLLRQHSQIRISSKLVTNFFNWGFSRISFFLVNSTMHWRKSTVKKDWRSVRVIYNKLISFPIFGFNF